MFFTAGKWSEMLGGLLEGDEKALITHPAKIEEAGEGAISFIANPKYLSFAYITKATVLIVDKQLKFEKKISSSIIRVENPYAAFTQVLQKFNTPYDGLAGIEKNSSIHESVKLSEDVYVGSFSYISKNANIGKGAKIFPQVFIGENVTVGEGTVIFPAVKIYRDCVIGKNCVIHSGTVIGSDGFGFAPQPDGSYVKIPQLGNVLLEDEVEIGANTTIDRATIGSTIIHKGVKLDNLVQVAHNVEIGLNTVVAAQTGISGSTKLGSNCMIGGQVGFVGHIQIADGSRINAQSGVSKSIDEKGKAWNGAPAFEYTASLRSQTVYRRLPELEKKVEELERIISELEKKIGG